MDEYEVNIHAMEDIEEGELTSDEEGEIKGQGMKFVTIYKMWRSRLSRLPLD